MESKDQGRITVEKIKLEGSQLIAKVRELINEGSARRVTIKKEDRILMEFPLTVGVGGTAAALMFAPTLAAIGAVAALLTDVEVLIERNADPDAEADGIVDIEAEEIDDEAR